MDISVLTQEFYMKYKAPIEKLGYELMTGFKPREPGHSGKGSITAIICSNDPIPDVVKQQIKGKLIPDLYKFQNHGTFPVEIEYDPIPEPF